MSTSSSSSSSLSVSVSERELEVASILQELPALIPLHYRVLLRWAHKRPRSRLKPHDDHPCKDDEDHTPSSSPISPLCFSFDSPPQPQHQHQHQHRPSLLVRDVLRVKEQARAIARLREANRSLQREAERERARYEGLLAENSRLKRLRSRSRSSRTDDELVVPPRLWMPGGIYPCNTFGLPEGFPACHVAAWEERKAATAEARRRRIEIKRRRKAERTAAL